MSYDEMRYLSCVCAFLFCIQIHLNRPMQCFLIQPYIQCFFLQPYVHRNYKKII
jgi:hypothetical protein